MNNASAALDKPDNSCPSNISLIELVRANPGTKSIILPATNLSKLVIIENFKSSIDEIAMKAPQIAFIKNSFSRDLLSITDISFVIEPIKNAHIKSISPPPNNTENVDVAIPEQIKFVFKE